MLTFTCDFLIKYLLLSTVLIVIHLVVGLGTLYFVKTLPWPDKVCRAPELKYGKKVVGGLFVKNTIKLAQTKTTLYGSPGSRH